MKLTDAVKLQDSEMKFYFKIKLHHLECIHTKQVELAYVDSWLSTTISIDSCRHLRKLLTLNE